MKYLIIIAFICCVNLHKWNFAHCHAWISKLVGNRMAGIADIRLMEDTEVRVRTDRITAVAGVNGEAQWKLDY